MSKKCEVCGNGVFRDRVEDGKDRFVCVNPACTAYMTAKSEDGEESGPSITVDKNVKKRVSLFDKSAGTQTEEESHE
jgi:hypothetical protein